MNSSLEKCAVVIRDIPEALNELNQALNILDDQIEALNRRLEPAMLAYPEAPRDGVAPKRMASNLAEHIQGNTGRITGLSAQIERILNELQI